MLKDTEIFRVDGEGKWQQEQQEKENPHDEPRNERKPVHSAYSSPGDHRKWMRIGF
jgi:hypothetical protein